MKEIAIKTTHLIGGVVVILLLAGAAFFFYPMAAFSSVSVVHPVRGPAVQAVYATGTVEATVMMPIAARSPARLVELNEDEGSEVKKGQILMVLEAMKMQVNVAAPIDGVIRDVPLQKGDIVETGDLLVVFE